MALLKMITWGNITNNSGLWETAYGLRLTVNDLRASCVELHS